MEPIRRKTIVGTLRGLGRPRPLIIATVLLLAITMAFQNCSEPRGGGMLGSTSLNAPFAFDVSVDHFAYMSCSGRGSSSYDPSAFFTFRVGAYGNNAGLRITDEYLAYTDQLDTNQRAQLLVESPVNKGAVLEMAIRSASSIQDILIGNGGMARVDNDYQFLLSDLTQRDMLYGLFNDGQAGQWMRYIRGLSGLWGKRIEASLSYSETEGLADFVRQQTMNNGALVALTYKSTMEGEGQLARTPAEFNLEAERKEYEYVYGKGLRVSFKQHGTSSTTKPPRVLQSVESIDLLSRTAVSNEAWTCPAGLAYRIVRSADAASVCPKVADPASPSANLKALRRLLPVEDWWVNEASGCVVAKKAGDCYGSQITSIAYNTADVCGGAGQSACAHYVSLCTRQ